MISVKYLIKLFLPPVIFELHFFIKNKLRERKYFYSTISNHKKTGETILILGNGPSLKEQLDRYFDILSNNTCICVNHFVSSEYYVKLRPKLYIIIDPVFFHPCEDKKINEKKEMVFFNLKTKTTWNIELVIDSKYKSDLKLIELQENQHIKLLFINMGTFISYYRTKEQFKLFNKNIIAPPAQTVLNTALYLCIFWRYKNIVLLGADSSWHEAYQIDPLTNKLYINMRHFTGEEKMPVYSDPKDCTFAKFHEEFLALSNAFKSYWLLREYAEFNGVSIFNASTKSYIDAFERKPLEAFSRVEK
jgi:hypothetical protein